MQTGFVQVVSSSEQKTSQSCVDDVMHGNPYIAMCMSRYLDGTDYSALQSSQPSDIGTACSAVLPTKFHALKCASPAGR